MSRLAIAGFHRANVPEASAALAPVHLADWPARLAAAGLPGFALITCERAEVVTWTAEEDEVLTGRIAHALAAETAAAPAIAAALAVCRGRDAVHHLFRVASGLDSRLLGEDEIAGQLAAAAAVARASGTPDRRLDRLVRWALETGRRVRAELDAPGSRRSWAGAAVAAVGEHGGGRIALVGTGSFAEALAKGFAEAGLGVATIYGTHPERTAAMAARHGAEPRDQRDLVEEWRGFDAVVFATRGRRWMLSETEEGGHGGPPLRVRGEVEGSDQYRGRFEESPVNTPHLSAAGDAGVGAAPRGRPSLLLDLGEPPLVDPALASDPGVVRLDLASLEARHGLPATAERRAAAEALVEAEVERYQRAARSDDPRWLLAAHGSGDGSATNEAIRELAERVGRIAGRPVEVAFRRGDPAWNDLPRAGRTILAVPLLAAAGHFTKTVLPTALGTSTAFTAPVGTHPWLLQGRVDAVRLALSRTGATETTAVLVAGHGTERHEGSAGSAGQLARLLRDAFPAVPVAVGFLDQEPSLERATAELARFHAEAGRTLETLVLVRHFLGGDHADEDVPRRVAAARPTTRLEVLPPLLAEPALLPAVLDRFGFAVGPQVRIGTRRSPLALVQAERVRAALGGLGIPAVVVPRETVGDRDRTRPLESFATRGPFTDELEGALRRGEVDLAVHSVKDLPLAEPADLTWAAVLERGPAADVIVGAPLAALPAGARVGTCSPRRTGQLWRLRPDLVYAPVRGAIAERLAQLDRGDFAALVLAEAALVRLGLEERIAERLDLDRLVPEPGQGAIAIQIRAGDSALARRLAPLDHAPTRRAVTAERAATRGLEREDGAAAGAYAHETRGEIELRVRLLPSDLALSARDVTVRHAEPHAAARQAVAALAADPSSPKLGSVHLVGAGPGAVDLLTLRGLDRLRVADVVVHDRLLTPELLDLARPGAERVDVGKESGRAILPQRSIERLLVERARRGQVVVRLKGGDPFVFGRGAEELDACRAAGVPCEVVPGLSSAFAGPAGAGIPVTERGVARSVAVVSAHAGDDTPPLATAAHGADTVVVLMGLDRLGPVSAELRAAGRPAATPAAIVSHASWPTEAVRVTTLDELEAAGEGLPSPALVVVGPTAARAASRELLGGPLAGRTIALTRPEGAARRTRALLCARGARVVSSPLIEIELHPPAALAGPIAERLPFARYPWLVFTSKHGVAGFWNALRATGRDARALTGTRLAAVGPATAEALAGYGLAADLVPRPHRAEALVAALGRELLPGHGVLFPCGSRARRETADGLAAAGIAVDELEVYATRPRAPEPAFRDELERGVDALVFTSPSAVESFVAHGLRRAGAEHVVCLGPTTADEARRRDFAEPLVAAEHSEAGLVDTLVAALGVSSDPVAEHAA